MNYRKIGVPFSEREMYFFLLHNIETGCGAYLAFYPVGTGRWGKSGRDLKRTTHFHLMLRLRGVELSSTRLYVFMVFPLLLPPLWSIGLIFVSRSFYRR
jgi:hypothetical protein